MQTKKNVNKDGSPQSPISQRSKDRRQKTKCKRADPIVALSPGEPDLAALTSVVTEWLVPLLVQDFLREREGDSEVNSKKPSTALHGKEGVARSRIR
jgi:hypothetical protein